MNALSRIETAAAVISTALLNVADPNSRDGAAHEAAVELESRGLLLDRAVVGRAERARLAAALESVIKGVRPDFSGFEWSGYRSGLRTALAVVRAHDFVAGPDGRCVECGDEPVDASPGSDPAYAEVSGEGLSQAQLDGFACVDCGAGQGPGMAFRPAGFVRGSGQVFRCSDGCVALVDGSPGDLHDSCSLVDGTPGSWDDDADGGAQ